MFVLPLVVKVLHTAEAKIENDFARKTFLGDNDVSVKLIEDLHKKIQFLLHF